MKTIIGAIALSLSLFISADGYAETREELLARLRAEQIAKLKAWRDSFMQAKEAEREKKLKEEKDKKEQERLARLALRKPPARVWRIGNVIFWEPPATANQLTPLGYWVSEERNGEWTAHGDYLPHATARESWLFSTGPAQVETIYNQQRLGEHYYSPIVKYNPGEETYLVQRVVFMLVKRARDKLMSTGGVEYYLHLEL